MPDFEALASGTRHAPFVTGETLFSWSARRHILFRFCKRAYFIRYYLAQGGWEASAKSNVREAFLEKYLFSFTEWLERTVEEGFTRALERTLPYRYDSCSLPFEELFTEEFKFAVSGLLRTVLSGGEEGPFRDVKRFSFEDLYYRTGVFESEEEFMKTAKRMLEEFFRNFPESEAFRRIAETDAIAWRISPSPLIFDFHGVDVFSGGRILHLSGDTLTRFRFRFAEEEKEETLSGKVFALWGRKKYPGRKIVTDTFRPAEERFTDILREETPAEESLMEKSIQEMRDILPDGSISPEIFPETEKRSKCEKCRFRSVCLALFP